MAEITGFELKKKPKIFIVIFALVFQLLTFFGDDIGLPENAKVVCFGLTVFFYSFIILPRLNVWQTSNK